MLWKRFGLAGGMAVWLVLFLTRPALAYLDPGTGSFACQLFLAGLMSALFLAKLYWSRIRAFLSGFFSRNAGQ